MEEEIKLPQFDKEKFMQKERRKAKTAFVAFLFGILIAIICHFIWRNLDESLRWPLCFLFAIASIGFMAKILEILKIDIKEFAKREWFGSIAFYFFTWLAIFILSLNPPFYDTSPPKIDCITLPHIQQAGGSIFVIAHITDNAGIKSARIIIGENEYEMNADGKDVYSYEYSGENASYEIVAKDKNGNEERKKGELLYSSELIKIEIPDGKLDSNDEIEIRVYKNISSENFRVYYVVNGFEVNATRSGESKDYYIFTTSPKYIGWKNNSKNELKFYAETLHYFPGINEKYSNVIDGGNYTVETGEDEKIGKESSPAITDLPHPTSLRTPAFEIFAVFIAFIAILFIKKRK